MLQCDFRGLFIIDTKGVLRQMTVNDLPVGRSVDEVMRLVQAFQFNDKHGEGNQHLFAIAPSLNLTPLPCNKIFEIFSHMCDICNRYLEKAVTALGRVISGYTATECKKTVRTS